MNGCVFYVMKEIIKKALNKVGPTIELWGAPEIISSKPLYTVYSHTLLPFLKI